LKIARMVGDSCRNWNDVNRGFSQFKNDVDRLTRFHRQSKPVTGSERDCRLGRDLLETAQRCCEGQAWRCLTLTNTRVKRRWKNPPPFRFSGCKDGGEAS